MRTWKITAGVCGVLMMLAVAVRSELKDEIHVKPEKTEAIRKQKLKGVEDLPGKRPARPAGARKIQATLDLRLTRPTDARDLAALSKQLKSGEVLFRLAVAHMTKSTVAVKEACCSRLSDGNGCWWWCCGDRTDGCEDECELLYCEAK